MRSGKRFRLVVFTLTFVLVGLLAAGTAMGAVTRYDEDAAGTTYGPSAWSTFSWEAGKAYRYT